MDVPITKRLIISGLTPSITAGDISKRLTTFGTVKAADGFGLPDGLGQPRKFGYVTLETTGGKVAKCMNLLSGSTWKGAKLRFGEAKPDFKERIALENQKADEEPPKKRRKRYGGVYGGDMSLVTPENVSARPGWKVTPLGRMIRPVKMRPEHPLPDVQEEKRKPKGKGKEKDNEFVKKKRRAKDPDNRARRRTIDMTKWGSTHLKGVFLDLETVGPRKLNLDQPVDLDSTEDSSSDEDEDEDMEVTPVVQTPKTSSLIQPVLDIRPLKKASNVQPAREDTQDPAPALSDNNTDIEREKTQSLNLLASLFGNDDEDWVGPESAGSDVDMDELIKGDTILVEQDDDSFEVIPVDAAPRVFAYSPEPEDMEDNEEQLVPEKVVSTVKSTPEDQPKSKQQPSKLKDLFAPREEEASFFLLGHLNLLDLDEELSFAPEPPTSTHRQQSPTQTPITLQTHSSLGQTPIVLNPKQPLFFPTAADGTNTNKARPKDIFDVIKENHWYWRDPAVAFYRTETEDEIRKKWEERKGDLTREWKKRAREAGKVNRRRRGGGDGDND